MTGRIFDVKEFSVHDGPGARITFFLKGCPLRCLWCHNPEGQSLQKELMTRHALCEGCGQCIRPRESEAFRRYGKDPAACPKGLITESGTDLSPKDVLDRVLPLKEMLSLADGGVTFSGGEPLLQWEFFCESADLLRANGIHVALETCGYASSDVFQTALEHVDYVMMDLKLIDPQKHLAATGVCNDLILQNAQILKRGTVPFLFRTPLIPGYTDDPENLKQIQTFVEGAAWEQLPYNPLAGAKYPMLNRIYPLQGE